MRSATKNRARWKDERDLLDLARAYLSEAFPNPERVGCPPDEVLRRLAVQPLGSDLAIGEHVTLCSPCFKAYMAHLGHASAQVTQHQRSRRLVWLRCSAAALAAVTVLIVVIFPFIDRRHNKTIVSSKMPASTVVADNTTQAGIDSEVRVLIDLSSASPTRGAEQSAEAHVQIIPSRSPLILTMRLPFGSDDILYSITVGSGRHIVWSGSARAFRRNGETLLTVHADFTHIDVGKYDLQIISTGRRLRIPVLISKKPPKGMERQP